MNDEKVLTKEIAEEMMGDIEGEGYVYQFTDYSDAPYSDVPTLDLSDFTRIEDGVGEFLSEYEGRGFCSFCEPHVQSGLLNLLLDLSGVTALSPEEAESLSRHKGDLGLNGLTEMSTGIAMRLCEHKGGVLYLQGLKVLSQDAAMFLRRHRDLRVTLELLPTSIREILTPGVDSSTDEITSLVTDMWSTLSSKHRNEVKRILCFNTTTILTETVVDELLAENKLKSARAFTNLVDAAAQRLAKYEGEIHLSGLTELSDVAAECLSKCKGTLDLDGLTSLSDAAAESLSKHDGNLWLDGLTDLPDAAVESLSRVGGWLALNGLTNLSDAAAESLGKCQHELNLNGVESLSDAAAESLSKHAGPLIYLEGLMRLSDAAAEQLSKYLGALHLSPHNLPASAGKILRDAGHGK